MTTINTILLQSRRRFCGGGADRHYNKLTSEKPCYMYVVLNLNACGTYRDTNPREVFVLVVKNQRPFQSLSHPRTLQCYVIKF